MTFVCPRCGSAEVIVYPDGSGRCRICSSSFMYPAMAQAAPPGSLEASSAALAQGVTCDQPTTKGSGQGDAPESRDATPEWRRTYVSGKPRPSASAAGGFVSNDGWRAVTPDFSSATRTGGPVPYYGWDAIQRDIGQSVSYQKERRLKSGGAMVYLGSIILILAPIISLWFLQVLVSSEVDRQVSWGELYDALVEIGMAGVICSGVLVVMSLGFVGFILGYQMRRGSVSKLSNQAAIAAIVVGALGAFMAILIVGGVIGLAGGILVAVGGGIGLAP